MSDTVIKLENIGKQYRLGLVGTNTLRGDLQSWWYRMRGKEDPTLKIGDTNQIDGISSEYVWALQNINLEVKQGEILGIIGKNGAGKSTLLKLLSRVTAPSTGQIKVKGRIASLLEVGTGFHPELTGRENIFLNGAILGMKKPEIRAKFDEIVDFAGVARYIDTPVKRYSSGMYVRLAFAVAAHLEPDILIVDEVLAVGDAEFQKKAIGKMQDISAGKGRTVLFVSHNMASVEALCTRAVILENGEIVFRGKTKDAIKTYLPKPLDFNKPKILSTTTIGTGEIKVQEIILKDLNNKKLDSVKTGKSFKIVLKYIVNNKYAEHLQNINVSISIFNNNEKRLLNIHNKLAGNAYNLMNFKESNKLELTIYDFPIVSGTYFLTYNIYNRYDLIDKLDNFFTLNVHDGLYFNKKIKKRKDDDEIIINADWIFIL